jgi:hypothetical protein
LATFWTTAAIRIPEISSDGTAIFQRRPDQYPPRPGISMSTRGAKTMVPIASPTHHVSQPKAALSVLRIPVVSWAATPTVGATVVATSPPRARVRITERGMSSRGTGPMKRRTRLAPAAAPSAAPMPTATAVNQVPASGSPSRVSQNALAATDPRKIPGRARHRHCNAAAKATPAAGQTGAAKPVIWPSASVRRPRVA